MSVLVARGIDVVFGNRTVLGGADLVIEAGEHVGLVGVNGSGKSTLLRVLAQELAPTQGRVHVQGRVGVLHQEPQLPGDTVGACARAALAWHTDLVRAHEAAVVAHDERLAATLHDRLDHVGWTLDHEVDEILTRVGAVSRDRAVAQLSGGERRRVALALALLGRPDLLLLDEPTNHLDADTVEWLQGWLATFQGALVLVTHDRYLLEVTCTRIVEVENGATVSYDGSYADYLLAHAERMQALRKAEDRRLRLIVQEAAWASRSPAARSTKQKARLERLERLEATERLAPERTLELDLRTGARGGGVQLDLRGARKAYGGKELLGGLDLTLSPGERIGVLGPNGAGKSTLLRILAGVEAPDAGTLQKGARVQVAVLDQHRTGLAAPDGSDWSVLEAAGGGAHQLTVAGREAASWQRGIGGRAESTVHVAGFLERFLFPRTMLDQKVSRLSGGERARLLLARLLLLGATVLLLDEPTNDLDLLTLRVLEEALLTYDGSVVVVTHDRAFLDRVCTGVLAFESDAKGPRVQRYASRLQHVRAMAARVPSPPVASTPVHTKSPKVRKGLSFKEQKELEALPARIEASETEQRVVTERLSDPRTYKERPDEVGALQVRIEALPNEIEALYARWAELSERHEA